LGLIGGGWIGGGSIAIVHFILFTVLWSALF